MSPPADSLIEHAAFVRRLALRLAGPGDADDLAQDTMLAAHSRPPRHGESLRGWLSTIARNLWRNRVRNSGRARRHLLAASSAAGGQLPAAAEIAAREEVRRRVVAAVLGLPEPLQQVVLLRYYEGLESPEIGVRLGIAASSVRTRLQQATDRLRTRLDAEHGGDRSAWSTPLLTWLHARQEAPLSLVNWPLRGAAAAAVIGLGLWIAWPEGEPAPESAAVAVTAPRPQGAVLEPGLRETTAATAVRIAPSLVGEFAPSQDWRVPTSLAGIVRRADTRAPLADATVYVRAVSHRTTLVQVETSPPPTSIEITTDEVGTFSVVVPIGRYEVEVVGEGDLRAFMAVDVTPMLGTIQLIAIEQPRQGLVEVQVCDVAGAPVGGAEVRIALESLRGGLFGWGDRAALTGISDANGILRLQRPELGAVLSGGAVAKDASGRVGSTWRARDRDSAQEMFALTVVLQPPGAIVGHLTGLSDALGAEVIAHQSPAMIHGTEVFTWRGVVASDGAFRVDGLPPGVYCVQVAGAAARRDGEAFWNRGRMEVAAGQVVTCLPQPIPCLACGRVRGVVRDVDGTPVEGARITARLPTMNRLAKLLHHAERTNTYFYALRTTTTDRDGVYEMRMQPGAWQLVVSAPPLAMDVRLGLDVREGSDQELRHELQQGGHLVGWLGEGVSLWPTAHPEVVHAIVAPGVFELRDLVAGPWQTSDGRSFAIVAGETTVLGAEPRGDGVHRGVLMCEGRPVAGYEVAIGENGPCATTNADGSFEVTDRGIGDGRLYVSRGGIDVADVEATDGIIELPCHRIDIEATTAGGAPIAAQVRIGRSYDGGRRRYRIGNEIARFQLEGGVERDVLCRPMANLSVIATFPDGGRARAVVGAETRVVRLRHVPTCVLRVAMHTVAAAPCAGARIAVLPWGRSTPAPEDPETFASNCADDDEAFEVVADEDGVAIVRGVPPGPVLVTGIVSRNTAARVVTAEVGVEADVALTWRP
ncbi:MAG: sigma-70 family RNA polymerase sigma factor [Planctomycetes bacterium]|nr:sigma-70 family RNA polymerase sigma factor [Planctomycetota bacterium]